tara:strand:- start:647 stop:1171 length:525 start_codon:yes stop_codon:yes gene_type:complete
MALLVTRHDFAKNNRIISTSTFNQNVLNQHISDAQFIDVQKLLGLDFYNEIVRNPTSTANATLLDGGDYTYNGITYTNVGLRSVIVFYAYGRYVMFGSQTDTPFGLVQKQGQNSTEVDFGQKKTVSKMNQQTAFVYWENVRLFLDRKESEYSLWKDNCLTSNRLFRISKISRTN